MFRRYIALVSADFAASRVSRQVVINIGVGAMLVAREDFGLIERSGCQEKYFSSFHLFPSLNYVLERRGRFHQLLPSFSFAELCSGKARKVPPAPSIFFLR